MSYRKIYLQDKDINKTFTLEKTLCLDMEDSKYGKYTYPYTVAVSLRDYPKTREKIEKLEQKYNTEEFVKTSGNNDRNKYIYLKLMSITDKQKDNLYKKGKNYVYIKFILLGVNERVSDGKRYLNFEVMDLRKNGNYAEFPSYLPSFCYNSPLNKDIASSSSLSTK